MEQNNDLNNYDDGENGYAPNGSMNTGYANYTDDVSEENISSDIHSTDNDNVFIQTDDTSAFNPNKPMQINNGNNLFDFDNNKNLNSSFSDSSNANNMYSGNNIISQDGLPGDFSGNINSGDINGGNDKENKKIKKERKGAKKIFASIGCGIIFGIFACFSFYAVNEVAGVLGIGGASLGGNAVAEDISNGLDLSNRVQTDTGEDVEIEQDTKKNSSVTIQNVSSVVTDVTDVVEATMPSIVSITNSYMYNSGFMSQEVEAKGSGIIVGNNDNEILIVTNFHVIDGNEKLSVTFCDDTDAPAEVKGTESSMDLAVIAVDFSEVDSKTQDVIRYATMGDSDNLKVGEPAIAIGNALGYGQSVTTGVISAVNRQIDMNGDGSDRPFIQTDAAINEGNSGGALLNIAGELIGINSNKMGGTAVEGMGYAIPISSAKPTIEKLMVKETRKIVADDEKGCLGISGATLTYQEAAFYGYPEGVYVANVYSDSAADEAGIEEGDLISSFDGEKVTSMEQLQRIMKYYKQGEKVEVGVYKNTMKGYEEEIVEVTLGSPDDIDG